MFVNLIDSITSEITIEPFTHIIFSEFQSVIIDFIAHLNSMSSNSNHSPRLTTSRRAKNNTQVTRSKSTLDTIIEDRPSSRNSRTVVVTITCFNIFIIFMSNIVIHTSLHSFFNSISYTIKITFL